MQNQSFDVTNCDVVIVQYVSETNVFFFFFFFSSEIFGRGGSQSTDQWGKEMNHSCWIFFSSYVHYAVFLFSENH